jgi:hypothetical protein
VEERIFSLPGEQSPEGHVFQQVLEKLDSEAARLTLSMQLPSKAQERVKAVVKTRALTNRDRHIVFQQIDLTSDSVKPGMTHGVVGHASLLLREGRRVAWLRTRFLLWPIVRRRLTSVVPGMRPTA